MYSARGVDFYLFLFQDLFMLMDCNGGEGDDDWGGKRMEDVVVAGEKEGRKRVLSYLKKQIWCRCQ